MGSFYKLEAEFEIGEIPVKVFSGLCCGHREYWAKFPDNSLCCEFAEHSSADEAVDCARQRVARGFVVREVENRG